jgi:hypothetical protein
MKSLLILLVLMGCTQVTSLNLKKHQFGLRPTRIIWFQVAGFEEEHIAMLRFNEPAERLSSFEQNICVGKTWNYNLYKMRNTAPATFLAQITGKKNVKQNCEDAALRPIWSYLGGNGYATGVLEISSNNETSLMPLARCGGESVSYLSNVYFWLKQEPPTGAETFIYSQEIPLKANEFFYDRSCKGQICESTIQDNLKAISQKLEQQTGKSLFIIRDFSYLEALENRDITKARSVLADLEQAYGAALALARDSDDYLVLLTTGESKFIEMPNMGKGWFEFEKKGTGVQLKRTKLTNLVLASGARAENFCGIYTDASVFERILSGPKQQGLELKIINPFKL